MLRRTGSACFRGRRGLDDGSIGERSAFYVNTGSRRSGEGSKKEKKNTAAKAAAAEQEHILFTITSTINDYYYN